VRVITIIAFLLASVSALNGQAQTGTIVFYREPHSLTGDFKPTVFCDNEELARIENGTSFEITVPAGVHKCTVESLQRPGAIDVNVIAGKPSYVHVNLLQGWTAHAALVNTTESEYAKEQKRLKPLKEWNQNALVSRPETLDSQGTPAKRVFLTRRKSWLASGGFNPNGTETSQGPDYSDDFHKQCPNLLITAKQDTAGYAVTIDEIGLLDALSSSGKPTFQVAAYSRRAGLLYSGGTSLLKNAIKDACNAIGAK
jgi:hypothetical protein